MPNIKSAKKRVSLSAVAEKRNQSIKTSFKTAVKKFNADAVAEGVDASESFRRAISRIDRAVSKGVLHKKTAARKKSAIALKMNASN